MVSLIVAWAAAAAPCVGQAAADAPFAVPPRVGDDVRVVVEVWTRDAPGPWVGALADVARAHDAPIVFVVPPARAPELADALDGLPVAIDLRDGVPDDGDPIARAAAYADEARKLRRALGGRPRLVLAPVPRTADEATLSLAGYRVLLEPDVTPGHVPRRAARYAGARGDAVALPPTPLGGCVAIAPFRPDAADRAARSIAAASGDGLAVVRVVVDGRAPDEADAAVLGRWLDAGVHPADPLAVWAEVRDTPRAARAAPTGRLVPVADLRAAADALVAARGTLPRALPGGLSPTEAWSGFVAVLADRTDGETARLAAIKGPGNDARSALPGDTAIPRDEVVALARALVTALPAEVPASMVVGGVPVTAGELLVLFASAARGDDPATTRPIAAPEPNERGLGWGEAAP